MWGLYEWRAKADRAVSPTKLGSDGMGAATGDALKMKATFCKHISLKHEDLACSPFTPP